jgi:hypothetical protein
MFGFAQCNETMDASISIRFLGFAKLVPALRR